MRVAHISEIYSSLQGEGPYTGERQVFLRLAGCPLRCNYCDTPASLTVEGHRKMTSEQVMREVLEVRPDPSVKTVSVTGGEPLIQAPFLQELFPQLKGAGFKIYLETAGVHSAQLESVVEWCDVIAMDIKLPSATKQSFWEEHREFLKIGGERIFVKIVVESRSEREELETALSLLGERSPVPLVVLQPATAQAPDIEPPSEEKLSAFLQLAKSRVPTVRVMPQQHKIWGVR